MPIVLLDIIMYIFQQKSCQHMLIAPLGNIILLWASHSNLQCCSQSSHLTQRHLPTFGSGEMYPWKPTLCPPHSYRLDPNHSPLSCSPPMTDGAFREGVSCETIKQAVRFQEDLLFLLLLCLQCPVYYTSSSRNTRIIMSLILVSFLLTVLVTKGLTILVITVLNWKPMMC